MYVTKKKVTFRIRPLVSPFSSKKIGAYTIFFQLLCQAFQSRYVSFDPINILEKPITVGWGKKETQFHGSEGKEAAKRLADNVKPALAWDDRKVRISWRGDGEYFVVSSINSQSGNY